jgi:hypothetical protein
MGESSLPEDWWENFKFALDNFESMWEDSLLLFIRDNAEKLSPKDIKEMIQRFWDWKVRQS